VAYQSHIRIRFGDEDHAGIVYYPRFFDFFHRVLEDFFNDNGHAYQQVLDVEHVGWPSVHAEADFRAPIRFGDVLDMDMWVERMGRSSVTMAYRGRARGQDVIVGRVISACIDLRTFKAQPIPDKYRAFFERFRDPPPDWIDTTGSPH